MEKSGARRPGQHLRPAAREQGMKIVLIPDSYKGTLSSVQACDVLAGVFGRYFPGAQLVRVPVADGGEGSVDAFLASMGGKRCAARVHGPFGEEVQAAYAVLPDDNRTAVIEMSACAGLPLAAKSGRLDPAAATTFGVGELILDALQRGSREILLCLGGSATNDGGAGCAAALGVRFLDGAGRSFMPVGKTLQSIAHIDLLGRAPVLNGAMIRVLCDIDNPMTGPQGAAAVFGPQKGATPTQVSMLDSGLRHMAEVVRNDLGVDVERLPGAGAAGGMGGGAVAFLSASLCPGIELILDTVGFDSLLEGAALVVTGEGRIDRQSVHGKVLAGVARRAKAKGVPVLAIGGVLGAGAEEMYDLGVRALQVSNREGLGYEELLPRAAWDLRQAAEDACRMLRLGEELRGR